MALVRRMIAGDERAFDEFAAVYIPAVHRFAAHRLRGERELVREVVQATICKAIAKLASFRGEAALMTWLCACCRNEIAGHFRQRQRMGREVELEEADGDQALMADEEGRGAPESTLLKKESAQLVRRALESLPPHYGQALAWKYLENLSVQEIAGRLCVGLKAAESLLTRARVSFRATYAELSSPAAVAMASHRFGQRSAESGS